MSRSFEPHPAVPVADVEALRAEFFRHVCQTSDQPLGVVVAGAQGTTIWDATGRPYLDLLAGMGVANIGHSHPAVVAAVTAQAAAYLHVAVYGEMVQAPQVRLAARLAEVTPGDLSVVYFTNSGAEAVEGALKTARKFTGRPGIVAFHGAFHGDTFGALSVGGNPLYREPFEPLLPGVRFLPFDDAGALEQIDTSVGAVIVEPVQGEGGVRVPGDGFLPALRRRCDAVGALLIADEVVTGFGRTGDAVRVGTLGRCAGHPRSGEGAWGRYAVGRVHRASRGDAHTVARSAAGARDHVRWPSGVVCGGPGRARCGAGGRVGGARGQGRGRLGGRLAYRAGGGGA